MNARAAAATIIAVSCITSGAESAIIHHSDLTEGLTEVTLTIDSVEITVEAAPDVFMAKTVNGVTGVGIAGRVDGEIDYEDSITFAFSEPVMVTMLTVTHLFTARNMGDGIDETALIVTDAGSFTLEATTGGTATWTGLGQVDNMSAATDDGSGEWMVHTELRSTTGILGGPITILTLESADPSRSASMSDFSFVEMEFAPLQVPTPPTAAALAFAAAGLATRRRRTHTV